MTLQRVGMWNLNATEDDMIARAEAVYIESSADVRCKQRIHQQIGPRQVSVGCDLGITVVILDEFDGYSRPLGKCSVICEIVTAGCGGACVCGEDVIKFEALWRLRAPKPVAGDGVGNMVCFVTKLQGVCQWNCCESAPISIECGYDRADRGLLYERTRSVVYQHLGYVSAGKRLQPFQYR